MLNKIKKLFDLNASQIKLTDKPLAKIKENLQNFRDKDTSFFRDRIDQFRRNLDKINERIPQEEKLSLQKIDRRKPLSKDEEEIKKKLYEFLPEFYAMVGEVYRRKIGITYHDVQYRAGIILAQGQRLVELATGEGKTMTFQLPLFLYSLAGRGAHLVTVNDYLSKRDGEYAGHVAVELGLSLGIVSSTASYKFISDDDIQLYKGLDGLESRKNLRLDISKMDGLNLIEVQKRESYACDITYGTNNEFGFDYLRDNMSWETSSIVQRELYFCVIDEADSILIDEARTPLIISGMPSDSDTAKYKQFAGAVRDLNENEHFVIDHKTRSVSLTEEGIKKVESNLGIDNLWKDYTAAYHIENAVKAKALFKRDDQYLVRNGEVLIVDEFTGRVLAGRRYSEGLHQAIEAKEGVEIKQESKTYATITFQNYFRLYKILTGGSGTVMTEAEEFFKIYGLESVPIPTNRPVIRKDYPDVIYKNQAAKFRAVIEEIKEKNKIGQPILVGTVSVEKSELISELLTREGIDHEVLNAKFHEQEAKIIEQAGRRGAVTVATNMAGRGADIVIGGGRRGDEQYKEILEIGGLHVIGTERHEARRIDNQLRGRTGRQGEPGSSRFFVSLEDQLMKILGGEIMQRLLSFVGLKEDMPIEMKLISKQIETAQKRIEGMNFDNRKRIVDYDDVMNQHREIFYTKRRSILSLSEQSMGIIAERDQVVNIRDISDELRLKKYTEIQSEAKEKLKSLIKSYIENEVINILDSYSISEFSNEQAEELFNRFINIIPLKLVANAMISNETSVKSKFIGEVTKHKFKDAVESFVVNISDKSVEEKLQFYGVDFYYITKMLSLQSLDNLWVDHLELMKDVRDGIGLQAYAQKDPLVEYKNEAFVIFGSFMRKVNKEIATKILRVERESKIESVEPRQVFTNTADIDEVSTGDREFIDGEIINQKTPEYIDSGNVAKNLVEKMIRERRKQEASITTNSSTDISSTKVNDKFKGVGRNDPCPCGSGKKFKKCHGQD